MRAALAKVTAEDRIDRLDAQVTSLLVSWTHNRIVEPVLALRGTEPGKRALLGLNEQALNLIDAIEALGPDETMALRRVEFAQREVLEFLDDVNSRIVRAHEDLSLAIPVPVRRGAPPKRLARQLACHLASVYRELSGADPTISTVDGKARGPFLDLVLDVFNAFAVDGSAETWARNAVASLKEEKAAQKSP
jgi:hypothetical protein